MLLTAISPALKKEPGRELSLINLLNKCLLLQNLILDMINKIFNKIFFNRCFKLDLVQVTLSHQNPVIMEINYEGKISHTHYLKIKKHMPT